MDATTLETRSDSWRETLALLSLNDWGSTIVVPRWASQETSVVELSNHLSSCSGPSLRFPASAIDVWHVAERDDHSAPGERRVVGRIHNQLGKPAVGRMLEAENQQVHAALQINFVETLPGPRRTGLYLDFLHPQGLALLLEKQVEEAHDMRPDCFARHAQAADLAG